MTGFEARLEELERALIETRAVVVQQQSQLTALAEAAGRLVGMQAVSSAESAALMRALLWLGFMVQRAGAITPAALEEVLIRTHDGMPADLREPAARVLLSLAHWKAPPAAA